MGSEKFSRGLTVVAGVVLLAIPTVSCSDSTDQPAAEPSTATPTTADHPLTVASTTPGSSTVMVPESPKWVRDNGVDIGGLGAALDAIRFYFDHANNVDTDGLRSALVACAPPAATLAESLAAFLTADQSSAFGDIADLCTSMAAMEASDDGTALAAARRSLDATVGRVMTVFDAFDAMMSYGDANESDTTTTVP
jgi:hypothetical protein